jgi:hypothetical protein
MDGPPATPPPPDELPEPPTPGLSAQPGFDGPSRQSAGRAPVDPTAGWLVLGGGILVLVGVFLPWFTVTIDGTQRSTTGTNEWGVMLLAAFAIARGLTLVRPDRFRFGLGTPLIGGVILVVLLVIRWNDIRDALDTASRLGFPASVGIGFYAAAAGTACILIGGLLSMRRRA